MTNSSHYYRQLLPLGCALFGVVVLASVAEAGSPRLTRLSPPGAQRGTTIEVIFQGRYLEMPQDVLFYESGITLEAIDSLEGDVEINGRRQRVEAGTQVRATLKIDADCELGPHGVRLRTARGLTEYQRFFVGPFPTVEENEDRQKRNDKRDAAKEVPVNSTVLGRLEEQVDVDVYKLQFQKGQRISVEIEAARLGVDRGVPDLHVAILDNEGKLLATADDSALYVQDPVASLIAPRDGTYFVEVRHSIYNASNDIYRLHVGTFVRPTGVYPAGGQVGEQLEVRILGDPKGEWTQKVRLPSHRAGNAAFVGIDSETNVSAPGPNSLRVSKFPNRLEVEPNDSADSISGPVAELPMAFNGIIERPGDVDCFRFIAKKSERFRFHALANALGSPLDPTITVRSLGPKPGAPVRAEGSRPNQLGVPPIGGLNRETLDPILEFNVPADGEYLLTVEDDRGNGGSDFVYRVEVSPETDAVYTYIPLEPENQFTPQARQAINIPAGGRYNTSVAIFNASRPFNGDLELVAVGLPEGVTMHAPKITSGMTRVPVVFEAVDGFKPDGRLIEIVAKPAAQTDKPLPGGFRQVVAMNSYGNNDYFLHIPLEKLAIAVTEPAPFSLEVDAPKSGLVQNGEMAIKFVVKRNEGYDGPVTVSMEWKPNGVSGSTPVSVRSGVSEGEYLLSAARNATAGTYQVVLTAVSGGERPGYYDRSDRTYVASRAFELSVAEPHVDAKLPRLSIERGKTAQLIIKLNHLKPFEGRAKATLARLPRGIELVEPFREVSSEDTEVTFLLRATDECLVGNYQGVTLDLTVAEEGQFVRQLTGYGMIRIDSERGIKAAAR